MLLSDEQIKELTTRYTHKNQLCRATALSQHSQDQEDMQKEREAISLEIQKLIDYNLTDIDLQIFQQKILSGEFAPQDNQNNKNFSYNTRTGGYVEQI